jgi:hypothetical protein
MYITKSTKHNLFKMSSVSAISANSIFICIDDHWFDFTGFNHPGVKLKGFHLYDATSQFNSVRDHADVHLDQYEIKNEELIIQLNQLKKRRPDRKLKF